MAGDVSIIRQEINATVSGAAWIIWKLRDNETYQLVLQHGLSGDSFEKVVEGWAGHEELLRKATQQRQVLRAQGEQKDSTGSNGGLLELVVIPLLEQEKVVGLAEFLFRDAKKLDQFLNSGLPEQISRNRGASWLNRLREESSDVGLRALAAQLADIQATIPTIHQLQRLLDEIVLRGIAFRCSLIVRQRNDRGQPRMIKISGGDFDPRSEAIRNLCRLISNLRENVGKEPEEIPREQLQKAGIQAESLAVAVAEIGIPEDVDQRFYLVLESFDSNSPLRLGKLKAEMPVWQLALSSVLPREVARYQSAVKRFFASNWGWWTAAVLLICVLLIPVPLRIRAEGEFLPRKRQTVYAPERGIIHRQDLMLPEDRMVNEGQPLLTITSLELETALSELQGKIATVTEQIRTLENTRPDSQRRSSERPTAEMHLGIRLAELKAELSGLETERDLMKQRLDSLNIESPLTGQILTWDALQHLSERPVQPGQELLIVGDPTADWEAVVSFRLNDLKYLKKHLEENSREEYELVSLANPERRWSGQWDRLAPTVEQQPDGTSRARALLHVPSPEQPPLPGSQIRVSVTCGSYPLGFVMFRGPWETIRGYLWW